MERPFPAYEGTEPFIFVCYAHDDAALVYPELTRLRDADFHIWYDEGISPGSEWSESLAQQIQQCAVFLFFVTPRSVEREHCRREVNFALEERCTILPVHLEPTDVPAALKLSLSHRQAILRHEHAKKAYEQKLDRALEAAALGRTEMLSAPALLQIRDWRVDVANHQLLRDDEAQSLDPKDLSVLLHLAEAAPEVVSSEALLNRSWPGAVVGDNALHQVIGRLRRAFGDDARNPSYIETLSRRGYRLLGPVSEVHSPVTIGELAAETPSRQPTKPWKVGWRIAFTALAMVLIGAALVGGSTRDQPDNKLTIAVLPLASLDRDPDHEQFTVGVTRNIWNGFRRLEGVQLIAQTSSNRYAEGRRDAREIAQRLNADYLVEGTVLRTPDRVRVTFSLINGSDGTSTLTQEYDRVITDPASLFELYDDIAVSAGGALERFVGGLDIPTHNLTALNLYERSFSVGDPQQRLPLLERALQADPEFLDARAHLSFELADLAESGNGPTPAPMVRRARDEALKVLAEDPDHAHAALALARTDLLQHQDASAALAAFEKAGSLGAHPGGTAIFKAAILVNANRFAAAERTMRSAFQLDPENAHVAEFLARTYYLQGAIEQAWQTYDRALSLDPYNYNGNIFALLFALAEGDANRYREVMAKGGAVPDWAESLALVMEGNRAPLMAKLREYEVLRDQGIYISPMVFTTGYWWAEQYEEHIRWNEFRERERSNLYFLNFDIAIKPNYWEKLETWAYEETERRAERQQLLRQHRARIARITDKMVLSDEEVLRALTPSEVQPVWSNPFSYLQEAFDFTGRSIQGGGS